MIAAKIAESLSMALMLKILDLIKESGADQREAITALRGAEVFLAEACLRVPAKAVLKT